MAKKVDALPPRVGGHRKEEYDYDTFLDGNVWLLTQGTKEQVETGEADYSSSHVTMTSSLRGAARRRGLKIDTRSEYPADLPTEKRSTKTQTGVYVQSRPMTPEELSKRGLEK